MTLTQELRTLGRLARRLPSFLRQRVTLEEARAELRRRLENREGSFLDVAERGIYAHPGSPYLPLLRLFRCNRLLQRAANLIVMLAEGGFNGLPQRGLRWVIQAGFEKIGKNGLQAQVAKLR